MAASVLVRAIGPEGIPAAVALLNREGWAFSETDLMRIRALGVLWGAFADTGLVGVTSAMRFGPVGWIGNVVVDARERGRGVGTRLVARAVQALESDGARSIGLYSMPKAIPLYERLGFLRLDEVVSLRGTPRVAGPPRLAALCADDLSEAVELDARAFGAEREPLVRRLAADFAASSFVLVAGAHLAGFAVLKLDPAGSELGPVVVDGSRPDAAPALLDAALGAAGGAPVEATVSSANPVAVKLLSERGLVAFRTTYRMVRGPIPPADHRLTFAAAGMEKG
ncbi:MAG: GNAT family N-acetyltransferase [Methanobacteriota archaeon]